MPREPTGTRGSSLKLKQFKSEVRCIRSSDSKWPNPSRYAEGAPLSKASATGANLINMPNVVAKRKRYWEPSLRLIESLRDYTDARIRGGLFGTLQSKAAVLRHRFWSVVTGADIPLNTFAIGAGLVLPHPNGIVIHPEARIGPDCRLFQQVTIGTGPEPGLPQLGARVWVGAGAKILGGVVIGDDAIIGANAVVITNIPESAVAAGIPAVVKPGARRQWDKEEREGVRKCGTIA
jgi:serine O-acetyltransferase